jgi:hypothetical protein
VDYRGNETIEELKAMLSLKPQIDTVPHAEGNFGYEKTNPIPVCYQAGELKYLATLRCGCDEPFFFQRLGNCGSGPDKHLVDVFELQCRTRTHRITLYFDMYHTGPSARIPDGLSQGKRAGIGLPHRVPDFPDGLSEFFKYLEERRKFRSSLK